jgi:hypothetical protein
MKVVCAWCGTDIDRSGYDQIHDKITSHGMCSACWQALASDESGVPLQHYIDSIPLPILLVDNNNTSVGMNTKASEILGRNSETIKSAQFGLVFDCIHSHRPEGCGRTIHCSGCAIRRCVAETFSTGGSQIAIPATLSVAKAESDVALTITTVKSGRFVLMRVDPFDLRDRE